MTQNKPKKNYMVTGNSERGPRRVEETQNKSWWEETCIKELEQYAWYSGPHDLLRAEGTDKGGRIIRLMQENLPEIVSRIVGRERHNWDARLKEIMEKQLTTYGKKVESETRKRTIEAVEKGIEKLGSIKYPESDTLISQEEVLSSLQKMRP